MTRKEIVTLDVTTRNREGDNFCGMSKRTYQPTYIKQWREHRGLSLRRLADRLEIEDENGGALSYVSINRIEKGIQPYSQPILEAMAHALDVSVVDLLSVDPTKDGEVVDFVRLLHNKTEAEKRRAFELLKLHLGDSA